jgi:hypothetical protein
MAARMAMVMVNLPEDWLPHWREVLGGE